MSGSPPPPFLTAPPMPYSCILFRKFVCDQRLTAALLPLCQKPPFSFADPVLYKNVCTQVYGISWSGHYSVYENWKNTFEQRKEMLTYEGITGLDQCQGY